MQARALSGRAAGRAPFCAVAPRRAAAAAPRAAPRAAAARLPDALLFDCDGVIVDTEKDGHRVSFNDAFKRKGLDHEWGVELYGELLEIGGGKERMTKYFGDVSDREPFKSTTDPSARSELVKGLHLLKTDLFMELVETGAMPLRPGVARLVNEAIAAGLPVAVCSTSNERAVSTIVRVMLGPDVAKVMRVFAGDVVPKKKPDPAIYLLAAKELGVDPARCVVVEDSRIGLQAAKAAGMTCIITQSSYTKGEDFAGADAVHDSLDAGGVTLPQLAELAAARSAAAA
ncbi:MAG: HAD-like domain-containing protein [Monoraphidium minutum]|nr:MAG: HAD-like domain-containing protein [Monoraphidium minutum]